MVDMNGFSFIFCPRGTFQWGEGGGGGGGGIVDTQGLLKEACTWVCPRLDAVGVFVHSSHDLLPALVHLSEHLCLVR